MMTNVIETLLQLNTERQQIDWDSPLWPVNIFVELPFWLRLPDHSTTVGNTEVTINARISNNCHAFLNHSCYWPSYTNIVTITDHEGQVYYDLLNTTKHPHLVHKKMKTVVVFEGQALSGVLLNIFGEKCGSILLELEKKYLRTLVFAHLEFLNQLIERYRSTVFDPFVYPVCEKDVPVWFVEYNQQWHPVHIFTYLASDSIPIIQNWSTGEFAPSYLIDNPEPAWNQKNTPMLPESRAVYDAWTCYYHGNYVEAIRFAVTGIEIAIDRCLAATKSDLGETPEEIDAYFKKRSNAFKKRFDDYYSLKKRGSTGYHTLCAGTVSMSRFQRNTLRDAPTQTRYCASRT